MLLNLLLVASKSILAICCSAVSMPRLVREHPIGLKSKVAHQIILHMGHLTTNFYKNELFNETKKKYYLTNRSGDQPCFQGLLLAGYRAQAAACVMYNNWM